MGYFIISCNYDFIQKKILFIKNKHSVFLAQYYFQRKTITKQ